MLNNKLTDQQISEMKRNFSGMTTAEISTAFHRLIDEVRSYRDECDRIRTELEELQWIMGGLEK